MIKRLLCIVGSMNAGGAETFLMKMYRALDKSKYQMDFAVAMKGMGFYNNEIISMGGVIYYITPKSQGALKNFWDIERIVKKHQYKYVLRTSQHSLSALELLAAKVGGAQVRIFRSSNSNTTTGSLKQMILHQLCKFMPRLFANVRIAPSTEAAEYMFGKNCVKRGRAHLIKNAIDTDYYAYSNDSRLMTRKEFGICDDNFVVGHIGRFNQQKNHIFLIDIFKEILKKEDKAILLLVGIGELQNAIKNRVNEFGLDEHVIFANVRNDIPSILSAMDVFIFPSLYEGMPNTVIEAQATGLDCIISEAITREADITGLVKFLPLRDPQQWAVAACKVKEKKGRISPKRQFEEQGYSVKSAVNDFINCVYSR